MAHIYQILVYIATAYSEKGALKTPKVSEALAAFALPAMAEAMGVEEEAAAARAIVSQIKSVARRTGGKVKIFKVKK